MTTLQIGNTHKKLETSKHHEWTAFVKGGDPVIESVVFHLHPTFKNPVIKVSAPPFELTRTGWGVFNVKMEVHLKSGGVHTFEQLLDFTRKETHKEYKIQDTITTATTKSNTQIQNSEL